MVDLQFMKSIGCFPPIVLWTPGKGSIFISIQCFLKGVGLQPWYTMQLPKSCSNLLFECFKTWLWLSIVHSILPLHRSIKPGVPKPFHWTFLRNYKYLYGMQWQMRKTDALPNLKIAPCAFYYNVQEWVERQGHSPSLVIQIANLNCLNGWKVHICYKSAASVLCSSRKKNKRVHKPEKICINV